MRTAKQWMVSALALVLVTGTAAAHAQYGPPQGPPQGPPPGRYDQGPGAGPGGWDAPPPEFREAQRQGFRDGTEGARKDVENRRRPNVNNRDEYRHPDVPRGLRRDYRDGFQRGYNVAMQHILGGGPGPRPY